MHKNLGAIKTVIESGEYYRIVFLGDSLTSTEWVHPNWRSIVEYVLKSELEKSISDWKIPSWNIRTLNAGYDGSTTRDLLRLIERDVVGFHPQLVFWMTTANDLHSSITPEEHGENVEKIAKRLAESGANIICGTSIATLNPSYDAMYEPLANVAESTLKSSGIQFIDTFRKYREFDLKKLFTFISQQGNPVLGIKPGDIDFAHPNQLGNAYVAKLFLEEGFGISFDPERYIAETLKGEMFPGY